MAVKKSVSPAVAAVVIIVVIVVIAVIYMTMSRSKGSSDAVSQSDEMKAKVQQMMGQQKQLQGGAQMPARSGGSGESVPDNVKTRLQGGSQ